MGQCGGKEVDDTVARQAKVAKNLDKELNVKREKDSEITKLLLLGTGESGKSTLFKQIVTSYGPGISDEERNLHVKAIHEMVLQSMKTFAIQASALKAELKTEVDESFLENLEEFKRETIGASERPLTPEKAKTIETMWKNAFLKELYGLRFGKYYILDSAEYFLNKVTELAESSYLPSDADLVRMRAPTTGINQIEFSISSSKMLMVDVGGQRNERKKWMHCFDSVTAVLFVVGLSEYDQFLYEDSSVNRLVESTTIFDSTVNSTALNDINIILLLNKRDLFAEKIKKVPLTFALPSYPGPEGDFDRAVTYIEEEFRALNKNPARSIYVHLTCATDTTLVQKLIQDIRETVVQFALAVSSLV